MMKGSQSISDLTNAMDAPNNSRISEHSGTVSAQGKKLSNHYSIVEKIYKDMVEISYS